MLPQRNRNLRPNIDRTTQSRFIMKSLYIGIENMKKGYYGNRKGFNELQEKPWKA